MSYCTTQGIVLRSHEYRENDRILTLLTPERGRVSVTLRGCRKIKSPLMAAGALFTMGEFVTFKGKGHELVTSFTLGDSFYPLRSGIMLLTYASLLLSAAEAAAQEEEKAEHLFILLARSLTRLSYGEYPADAVTAAYLIHLSQIEGFKPRLNHCVACGKTLAAADGGWLDAESGGLKCGECAGGLPGYLRLTPLQIGWLRDILVRGVDKVPAIPDPPLTPLIRYAEYHLGRKLPEIIL